MVLLTPRPTTESDEVTVLVHGLWMQGVMMKVMGGMLELKGFRTHSVNYDFLTNSPASNAKALYQKIGELGARRVNLVGHSLGGIVILHLLHQFPECQVGKIVLIGSPVRGSDVARRLHRHRVMRPLLGRSTEGGLLGGAPLYEGKIPIGVITGSGRLAITALLHPTGDKSDGVVRESETYLENATDRISVARSHSTMIFSRQCAELVANFLRFGRFRR